MHINEDPPLAHTRRPGVPESVSYVLNRALAKSLGSRFDSVSDFAQALEGAVIGRPVGTSRSGGGIVQPVRKRRSGAGVALGGLLTLIILVIMGAFALRIWTLLGSDDGGGQSVTGDDLIPRLVQTLDAGATVTQQTLNAQTRVAAQATEDAISTQRSREQTATATLWTHTPTPNITASIEAYQTQRAAITQAWIDSWTATPTATATPTLTPPTTPTFTFTPMPDPLQMARTPVVRNTDWTPVPREFNGVEMVLVPGGCFEMGSNDGDNDERPVHRVCFEEPFWIDRYEVSQGQFAAFGGQAASASDFAGENRPVEQITWYEARDFCALRGAWLPTEAEWEYAARGPDALVYPWGNAFDDNKVIWNRSGSEGTAPVGSKPEGVSWVGAYDLSGNMWEWVADWYDPDYYGTLANGAIDPAGPASGNKRVLRGGSWYDSNSDFLRAADRFNRFPVFGYFNLGFRCARSAFG